MESEVVETVATGATSAAALDLTSETSWFAAEKLWPEHPFMGMLNASQTDDETWGLRFTCNIDKGELMGVLDFQPVNLIGQPAVFAMDVGEGRTHALPGVYTEGGVNGAAQFEFAFDWSKMKDLTETTRADFIDAGDLSVLALVSSDESDRGDTQILASLDGLTEAQAKFYYFCNPK